MDEIHCATPVSDLASDSVENEIKVTSDTRPLTADEEELLKRQGSRVIPEHKQVMLEAQARKHWDVFYKRNSTKFFKDRHWTTREFQELSVSDVVTVDTRKRTILEVGCGVGNFMFPLMNEMEDTFFYACDFSPRAVQFVQENSQYDVNRCTAFCCDVTSEPLDQHIPVASVDIASLIFCLSAIHPDKMVLVLQNIHKVLTAGGCVLVRDYGMYDHAMLRFAPGHKLADNFYVRQDGTRAYYFTIDKLDELFVSADFQPTRTEYILRETVNRKEGICVPRVFIQGKFVKRTDSNSSSNTDT